MVQNDSFRIISGKAKHFIRKAITGKELTYNMCEDCGSLVFVAAETISDAKIVKMGTIDGEALLNGLGLP